MKTLFTLLAAICIISVFESRAQDENWEKITSIKGGSVKRIAIDSKGTIYALTEIADDKDFADWVPGRLYSSIDNGTNWSVVANTPDLVDFVIANGTLAGLGYRDGSIHFMNTGNGVWTTDALGQNYPYTKIYHDGNGTFMFTSSTTSGFYGFYSTASKESKAFAGTYLDSFVVSDGYIYAINKTANAIVRSPIQSQLASYAPANWEALWQISNQSPIYSIAISGDRIYTTYYGDYLTRLKMAYALQSAPKNWIDISMPFGLEIFNTFSIYNVKLNTSPAGKIFLSFWGAETSQKLSGKIYVLDPVALTWDKSKKYPGENIAVPSLKSGLVWKSEQDIYCGTDGMGVARSIDGGGVWSLRNGTANNTINDITTGQFVKVGTGRILFMHTKRARGYYYSDDQGETWTFYTPFINGEPITFKSFIELKNSALIAQTSGESANSSLLYSSDGLNWSIKNSSVTSYILTEINGKLVSIYSGMSGWVVQYSNDLGSTWSAQPTSLEGYSLSNQSAVLADYIFIAANKNSTNSIIRINTSVTPWTVTPVLSFGNSQNISALFSLGDKLYVGDNNSIYVSDNLGESFTSSPFVHNRLIAVPEKSGGVALIKDKTCTVTQDDGQSFTNISTPYGEISEFFRANNGVLFASGVYGPVLKSKNSVIKESASLPDKITAEWIPLEIPFTTGGRASQIFSLNGILYSASYANLLRFDEAQSKWVTIYSSERNLSGSISYSEVNRKIIIDGYYIFDPVTLKVQLPQDNNLYQFGQWINTNAGFFVVGWDKIYKANEVGQRLETLLTVDNIYSFVESNGKLYTLVRQNGVVKILMSSDSGVTWSQTAANINIPYSHADISNGVVSVKLLSSNNGNIFLRIGQDVYLTSNGTSWVRVLFPGFAGEFRDFSAGNISSTKSFIALESTTDFKTYLYVTNNGGSTWTFVNNSLPGANSFALWQNKTLIATNTNGILQSGDDGQTTSAFAGNKDYYGFYLTSQFSLVKNSLVYSSLSVGYANSNNDGLTWSTRPGLTQVFPLGEELIGFEYNTPSRSTDNGVTWTPLSDQPYYNYYLSLNKTPNNEYISIYRNSSNIYQLAYSTDLKVWTTVQNNYSSSLGQAKDLTFFNGLLFLRMYGNDNLLMAKWTTAAASLSFSPVQGLDKIDKVLMSDGKIILFASTGTIYTSTNGEDWTAKPCPPGSDLYVTDLNYYFVMSTGTAGYLSADSGITWQKMDYNLWSKPFSVALDKNSGYGYLALPNNFVYKSSKILVQNNRQTPEVKELFPANLAGNVPLSYSITLSFSESVTPVAGKTIKIFEQNNLSTPVEVIQVTDGTRQDYAYSYTPKLANVSSKSYFVIIDKGAFVDLYNDPYAGINTIFQWSYSMQDATPPSVNHTPVNLSKGTLPRFQVEVTDNNTLPTDKTKIFFRGITKKNTDSFSQTALLITSGAGTNSIKQEISLPETAYDGMGLEYYFEAEDANGNKRRSPLTANTYYYSYIEYPAPNQPKINQALSFGGEVANYRIVSFPYKFSDSTTQTVLKSLQPYETTRWRLYGYAGGENFEENPSQLHRGRGYWMNVRNSTDITLEGASNPTNNKNSFYTIKLIPGWNLIGNPYPTTISWNEVKGSNASVGSVKVFEGNAFSNGNDLLPYQGGFVFVSGNTDVNLKVGFKGITNSGRIGELSEPISGDSWTLPLHVTSADFKNKLGGIGMKPDALEGQDNYDDYNPPVFMNYCQLESTDKSAAGFAKNVVSTSDEYSWSFAVKTNCTEDMTLSWDDGILSKLGKDFYLLDLSNQVLINMRERSSYQFSGTSQNAFKIFYGDQLSEKLKPTQAALSVSPNPASDFINLYYTIPDEISASALKIEIVDLTGRVVQVLENRIATAGFFNLKVNAEALEQNMYIVRMVTDSPGATKSITKKLIIRR